MYNIDNKVVVVTGGVNGIGFSIANKFLENGAEATILLDLNNKKGLQAVEELTVKYGANKALYIQCDVRIDLKEVLNKIIDKYDRIDVLVNSAGIASETIPKELLDINLVALIDWSLKFREYMSLKNGKSGGAIINIASILGITPSHQVPVYSASKYGVVGFSKSLGDPIKFDESRVRVIAICPGFTRTDLVKNNLEEKELESKRKLIKDVIWQDVDVVGEGVIEIYKKAESGTVWVIDEGNVSEFITKDYKIKRQE